MLGHPAAGMKRIGIFFDKDGTLVEDVPYNVAPEHIRMSLHAERALAALAEVDAGLFVITNQPGIALDYFSPSALANVQQALSDVFLQNGVRLSGFYYCPHHPEGAIPRYSFPCACRKPAPGLLLRAAREHDIDLGRSWMIGDILNDIEAGRRAGCRTVLINNGNETEWLLSPMRTPDYVAEDLEMAVHHILTQMETAPA